MSALAPDIANLKEALRSLCIIIKTVRLYPAEHPARRRAVADGVERFATVLKGQEMLDLAVRKDWLEHQEQVIAAENPAFKSLARHMFTLKVQNLTVLPELTSEDLELFARCLALEYEDIIRRGGLEKILQTVGLKNIWINETDLSRILTLREQVEKRLEKEKAERHRDPSATDAFDPLDAANQAAQTLVASQAMDEPESPTPEKLLERLKSESDDEAYRQLLRKLVDAVSLLDRELEFERISKILLALGDHCRAPRLSELRRDACRQSLGHLLDEELIQGLSNLLCRATTPRESARKIQNLLLLVGERSANVLARKLAEEKQAHARKLLAQTLVRLESAALPAVQRLLKDPRWYVVRNALLILGEIRDPSHTDHVAEFLWHDDVRVRREAVRTLARIGTDEAIDILLSAMDKSDSDLQLQALFFLGALKQRSALPHLLRLVTTADPLVRRAPLMRGAVRALGEIGAEEAVAPLAALLNRRKLLYKRRFQEIQEAAALALARIGTEEARSALSIAARQGTGRLAQTASRALNDFSRDHANEH